MLSTAEIKALLGQITNLKHKTIVSMLYSTGMRRGELLHLRINDINHFQNTIHIKYGKGGKDRIVPLSNSLKDLLQKYYDQYKPKMFVFEGMEGEPYSASSVAQVLIKNGIKARIPNRVTPHMLRHSFATHLLESGVSLRHIQVLLGHHSSRTTEIYTKVTTGSLQKIPNPLDNLG